MKLAAVAILLLASAAGPTAAAPSLAVALHAKPSDRPALRHEIETAQVARLKAWRAAGLVTGYRLLFSRYADQDRWDAFELLSFAADSALAGWRANAGAAFEPRSLALAQTVETTPAEIIRAEGRSSRGPSVLVIPYETMIPPAEYRAYLDGYTIPQFRKWMEAGVLDGFDIATSLYPAGRPWHALITLRYHDDAALGRREEVVQSSRAALAADPKWKAFAEAKKNVRTEHALSVADEIAAEGDVQ
jgi:hypothetical protein